MKAAAHPLGSVMLKRAAAVSGGSQQSRRQWGVHATGDGEASSWDWRRRRNSGRGHEALRHELGLLSKINERAQLRRRKIHRCRVAPTSMDERLPKSWNMLFLSSST